MALNQLSTGLQINSAAQALVPFITAAQANQIADNVIAQYQSQITKALSVIETNANNAINAAASQGLFQCNIDLSPIVTMSNPSLGQTAALQLAQVLNSAGYAFSQFDNTVKSLLLDWSGQTLSQANQQVLTLQQ